MLIFKKTSDLKKELKALKNNGVTIGFVPTMGALHAGHISLIRANKKKAKLTVCSIFVNPTQFNNPSDFEKYPITIESDIEKLVDAGCDILFLPTVREMYPHGFENPKPVDFGFLSKSLEGEHRPGHFDGMAQVVEKLLCIAEPDFLFMGLKDYQQQLIVAELIRKRGMKVKLIACETLRERDGLAMSSRNMRLSEEQRKLAVEIYKTLQKAKSEIRNPKSEIRNIEMCGLKRLKEFEGIKPEYFEIRNAETLQPSKSKKEKLIALSAAWVGDVRLIDNMRLN